MSAPDLSAAQAGRIINKSPQFIARKILSGELRGYRIGRTYRVSRADLDVFLERARVRPKASAALDRAVTNHEHEAAERRLKAAGL